MAKASTDDLKAALDLLLDHCNDIGQDSDAIERAAKWLKTRIAGRENRGVPR